MNDPISEWPLLIQLLLCAGSIILALFLAFQISKKNLNPTWVKEALYISLGVVLMAFFETWNEERLFSSWVENIIKLVFGYGMVVLAIFCGAVVGIRITKKTSRLYEKIYSDRIYFRKATYLPAELLGWLIGIIVAILLALLIIMLGKEIPIIGWIIFKD